MKYLVEPWEHQKEAIERAKSLNVYALFFEPGLGKSSTAINILRHRFNSEKKFLRTLIFCPGIVIKNWKDEWAKHSQVSSDQVVMLVGSGKERLETFTHHAYTTAGHPTSKIFITNYESLLMKDLFDALYSWHPEAMVFDESHRLKSPEAKKSKAADKLANPIGQNKVPLKYILSGSPVLNSPMDIFQQFKILDGGKTFGDNFWAFRNRYFYDKNAAWRTNSSRKYFPDWQILPQSLEEINQLLHRSAIRKTKLECLDLPPLVTQSIKVPMLKDQERIYRELARQYVAFLDDRAVSASMALVKALRLMQITSGFVSLDGTGDEADPTTKSFGETPKLSALKELLEELTPTSKVIIWAVWKENYVSIGNLLDDLGLRYVSVHGGISENQKRDAVDEFNNNSDVRVFMGHPGSGGIGINLKAPYSIFYSRTFSLEHSLQAEARNHRGDSKAWGFEKITRYDLVVENSIDEEVVGRLLNKEEISEKVLRNIREKILAK